MTWPNTAGGSSIITKSPLARAAYINTIGMAYLRNRRMQLARPKQDSPVAQPLAGPKSHGESPAKLAVAQLKFGQKW